jgi:hypothetical protein
MCERFQRVLKAEQWHQHEARQPRAEDGAERVGRVDGAHVVGHIVHGAPVHAQREREHGAHAERGGQGAQRRREEHEEAHPRDVPGEVAERGDQPGEGVGDLVLEGRAHQAGGGDVGLDRARKQHRPRAQLRQQREERRQGDHHRAGDQRQKAVPRHIDQALARQHGPGGHGGAEQGGRADQRTRGARQHELAGRA